MGFVFVISLYLDRISHLPSSRFGVVVGLSFGLFGVLNLVFAVEIIPGVVVDVRSPFIIVSGFMGGPPGVLTTAGILALWRFFGIGGMGAVPGTIAILANIPLGYAAYRWRGTYQRAQLVGLGFASVLVSVAVASTTLPRDLFSIFVGDFLPSALILYPLTTLALGELVTRELRSVQLNEQLRQSEARFRAIFNQTFQFIGMLKPDGTVLEANDTALQFSGQSATEVIGKPFWEARWWSNSAENRQQLRDAIRRAANGEFVRYRVDVQGQGETITTIDFSLTPIQDQHGNVTVIIPEGRDISSEILAEERRVELALERERGELTRQFIQDASHHLRTPITVLGTSHYLSRKILEKLTQRLSEIQRAHDTAATDDLTASLADADTLMLKLYHRVEVGETGVNDLSKVVEELLQLTRLDAMLDHEPVQIDLSTYLLRELEPYKLVAQKQQQTLTIDISPGPIWVCVDPDHISRVVQNLVENALHYTEAGGTVRVRLDTTPEGHRLQVSDTGIGIPAADQYRIFSRFYRSDNAATQRPKGSGLGLAIVKGIVDKEGGTITVDSQLGVGTTFTVTLPLDASVASATVTNHTPSPPPQVP
jgi:PAS domain S-box-containing protein